MAKKTAAQLDREIAEALSPKPARKQHPPLSGDDWDVATDAILAHGIPHAIQAAQVAYTTLKERGGAASPSFLKALHEAPAAVRAKYEEQLATLQGRSVHGLPYFYEMIKHPSDVNIWFKATEEMKKPGYKGLAVWWDIGARKPKKAKQSSLQRLDIDQGYYKRIRETDLPVEVRQRFDER
jgi:hypothetical protein